MTARRAVVVGCGLIGGSIGMGLRQRGWHVTGRDRDPDRLDRAIALGAVDVEGVDPDAEITFVATPAGSVVDEVHRALASGPGLVTDVAGVKARIVGAVDDPRFVGGHPMAGSEQTGVEGADPELFAGAVWVLTPTVDTPDSTLAGVRNVVSGLGSDVVSVSADRHDALVAVVSHVPHLTAASLMSLADRRAEDRATLLRLAAGGFRDMTRVSAGEPGIWPDICAENREAILDTLDGLIAELGAVRAMVDRRDRDGLIEQLERARLARRSLPGGVGAPEALAAVRVPIADRPGVLAEITTLAGELDINIADLEIAHSAEGERGVLILIVADVDRAALVDALTSRGFRPSARGLE